MYFSAKIPRLARIGYSIDRSLKLLSIRFIGTDYWSAEDKYSHQEKKDNVKEKIIYLQDVFKPHSELNLISPSRFASSSEIRVLNYYIKMNDELA
jgi:hypothetical protein